MALCSAYIEMKSHDLDIMSYFSTLGQLLYVLCAIEKRMNANQIMNWIWCAFLLLRGELDLTSFIVTI